MTSATRCECGGVGEVEETRPSTAGSVRRRRECVRCHSRWTTYESREAPTVARERPGTITIRVVPGMSALDLVAACAQAIGDATQPTRAK